MPSFKSYRSSPTTASTLNRQSITSINAMPFNENFEAEVNNNMNPSRHSDSKDLKVSIPTSSQEPPEADDREYSEKRAMKDQSQPPPRFSTIFDTKGPATPTRAFESYPQPLPRKSGIYIAKPLFWALFAIFLFESAVLFAYTVIGLVSNMSSKLVHVNSAGAVVAGCDCNAQPINISPNFYMQGGAQASVVETTTLSTSTSTSSTSSSSSSTSQSVSAGVSQLADIIKNIGTSSTSESSTHTPTTRVVTVTPPGPTIKSTTVLTVDPSGSTLPPGPTVTSTKVVSPDEASQAPGKRDEPTAVVSTTTTSSSAPMIVLLAAAKGTSSIHVNESMVSVMAVSPAVPTMSLSLKSHHQLANTPTQGIVPEPSLTMSLSLKSHHELANQPTQKAETAPSSATGPSSSKPSESVSAPIKIKPEPTPACTRSDHL